MAEDYRLEICSVASYAKLGYPGERGEAEVKKAVAVAEAASLLGAPVFRIKVASYDPQLGYEAVRQLFRRQLSQLLKALKREAVEAVPVVE